MLKANKQQAVPEIHRLGTLFIENVRRIQRSVESEHMLLTDNESVMDRIDFGIQVASDGRVWIFINGIAFLRFTPHPNRKMVKD